MGTGAKGLASAPAPAPGAQPRPCVVADGTGAEVRLRPPPAPVRAQPNPMANESAGEQGGRRDAPGSPAYPSLDRWRRWGTGAEGLWDPCSRTRCSAYGGGAGRDVSDRLPCSPALSP